MNTKKTRSDLALEARALRQGWQVSTEVAQEAIRAAAEIVRSDAKPRNRLAAARLLLAVSQHQLRSVEVEAHTSTESDQDEQTELLLAVLRGEAPSPRIEQDSPDSATD